jgi:hypothetical protein
MYWISFSLGGEIKRVKTSEEEKVIFLIDLFFRYNVFVMFIPVENLIYKSN